MRFNIEQHLRNAIGFLDKYRFVIASFIILIYFLPYFIFGKNVVLLIPDTLDSSFVAYKILAESGLIFKPSNEIISKIMTDLPRGLYGSEFNVIIWLFGIFPPFIAYIINEFLIRVIAFIGMYILIHRYIFSQDELKGTLLSTGIAVCFALLPFWLFGGLSVAGQPLALWIFLNIEQKKARVWEWVVLCCIPLYSSFVLSFLFFLFGIGCYFLVRSIQKKKIAWKLLLAIFLMGIVYAIVEYRLIYSMFFNRDYVSHRIEIKQPSLSLLDVLSASWFHFLNGQWHTDSVHKFIILPVIMIAFLVLLWKKVKSPAFFWLIGIQIAESLWFGIWSLEYIAKWKMQIPILEMLQLDRFYFLEPLIWYLIFALSIKIIVEYCTLPKFLQNYPVDFHRILKITLIQGLIILQLGALFYNNTMYIGILHGLQHQNPITYESFYAEAQFQQIATDINRPRDSYRIACLGFYPAIAQYNGFYTIDGYLANYPLEYKHQFRPIIAAELAKSERWQQYFDDWGSRCYIFSSELSELAYPAEMNQKVQNLELNMTAFKNLGAEYLFSAVEVENFGSLNLTLYQTYEQEQSAWRIYVYQVV